MDLKKMGEKTQISSQTAVELYMYNQKDVKYG
jgi:hypothetical protein